MGHQLVRSVPFVVAPHGPNWLSLAGGADRSTGLSAADTGQVLSIIGVRARRISLNGTIYNCAGGPTPWGTWLSCEETTEGPAHGWQQKIEIEDPDPDDAEINPLSVFAEGYGNGGALFSRLEGCWYGDGAIYFDATDGGNARAGQIWQYRPREDDRGELTLIYESPSEQILNGPDNLTISPRGGMVICEDTEGAYVRGLTPDGRIFDFARNSASGREFAGACFSPDGQTLFFNIQGDTMEGGPGDLGMTFAVWGPWERGML